jgi:hypothetical protein
MVFGGTRVVIGAAALRVLPELNRRRLRSVRGFSIGRPTPDEPLVEKKSDLHHVGRNTRFRQTTSGEVCVRFADVNGGLRFLVGDDGG